MRQIPLLTLPIALKYWESVVQKITKAGFSLGWVSAIDFEGRTTWIVDAHGYGKRFIIRAEELLTAFVELERAIHELPVSLLSYDFHHSLKSPLCLWELDILRRSIRKLRTYEEIHTVFARYLRCDGIYRFLSAGGNDSYGRT